MGKKRVIKPKEETLLKEREKVEEKITKGETVKLKKKLEKGRIYIKSSYNNTMITLADQKGNVLFWTSAGRVGFKGTKKGTPFAATKVAEAISQVINKLGIQELEVFVKGIGEGRNAALRSLAQRGINIVRIKDVTPIPHNGPKPPNPRRI
ncbi:MAG TPA: 30S ribosomal protein S11 [Candidatus Pacearchaeota archaeon]|nr:30S ribosomal protein S11 [Candidatus Pacearchaeota archaeon]HOK94261.1 30S ribosomal protein S11 [Candidatus Pacearchaeota archaeon]HPO75375.1 30S ribosomal protein S11 [Candidatus Pacearchaeota archaeon]